MLRKSRQGLLFAALTTAVFTAQAATTQQAVTQQYNLLDIYKLAVANDAQLAAAMASLKATQEGVNQSRATLLPQIGLSANLNRNYLDTKYQNGSLSNDFNSNGWSASLSQPLFNLGSWFTYDQAKLTGKQAETTFANAQQALILQVAEAYFGVLRAQDALMTAEAQEKALKQQLDQAQERFNVGLIAHTDVLDARAAYDNARVSRIQADNQIAVSFESIRTLVNQEIDSVALLNKAMPVIAPTPNTPDTWVQSALENNLSLKAARQGLLASEAKVKTTKSGHAPTVNAVASYGYSSNQSQGGIPAQPPHSDLGSTKGKNYNGTIGLQVSLPLFSGGTTTATVRQSGYLLEQAQKTYDQQLRTTNANTRNLLRTSISDVDRINAGCQVILSAESALEATQSGYEVGTRNITDVLNAQQLLYASMGSYFNTRYDFITNTLKLKQMAGTLSPADLEELNKWMTAHKKDEFKASAHCK